MPNNNDDDLRELFDQAGLLDEVPSDAAIAFEETLEKLLQEGPSSRRPWKTTATFLVAASVLGIFGISAFTSSDPDKAGKLVTTLLPVPTSSSKTDILTSGQAVEETGKSVKQFTSGLDYLGKSVVSQFPFEPVSSFGSLSDLDPDLRICLSELGLSRTVSVIDLARYGDARITAVWTALDADSWVVSVISADCQPLDEILIAKR